jgi:hypothetical protein
MIPGSEEDAGFARLARTPAETAAAAVRPACSLVWTAAEVMHWAGVQGSADLGIATVVASSLAWGAASRGWVPPALPAWVALAGGWTAAAWYLGPLAWLPAPMLTAAWIVITWAAHRAARRHPAVAGARQWREARGRWLAVRGNWGLGGSHLLDYQETRVGELYTVSARKASRYIGNRSAEEDIAEAENLPLGRVQILPHELAGRIIISIRRKDPWAEPILHPLTGENPDAELAERRSITDLVPVGQHPEAGGLLTIQLYDAEAGGKNIDITGIKGAGKDVLLASVAEHVTACDDAVMVWIDVSIKGTAQLGAWGPACHLTALGADAKARAVAVVGVLNKVIEWRARTYKPGTYAPSADDPAIVLVVNESDAAAAVPGLKRELDDFATKAREFGGVYIHAGQRNTNDYHSAKQRSQDDVHCTGMLANANEARHAGGFPPALRVGVWSISMLGGSTATGRTWVFAATKAAHGAAVERVAAERAFSQPGLPAECREYLGERYAALLASEVFPRWAQGRDPGGYAPGGDDAQDGPPAARPDDAAAALPAVTAATVTAVADHDLEEMWKAPMDESTAARNAAIHRKLTDASRSLAVAAAIPRPEPVAPETRAAFTAERWRQVADEPPRQVLGPLLGMLEEGTTISAVAGQFTGGKKWQARKWLEYLRLAGAAYVDGERSAARWRLAPPLGEGDAQ